MQKVLTGRSAVIINSRVVGAFGFFGVCFFLSQHGIWDLNGHKWLQRFPLGGTLVRQEVLRHLEAKSLLGRTWGKGGRRLAGCTDSS